MLKWFNKVVLTIAREYVYFAQLWYASKHFGTNILKNEKEPNNCKEYNCGLQLSVLTPMAMCASHYAKYMSNLNRSEFVEYCMRVSLSSVISCSYIFLHVAIILSHVAISEISEIFFPVLCQRPTLVVYRMFIMFK